MIEIIKRHVLEHKPISVNWHLWPYCNAKCKFCFATFRDVKGRLDETLALKVIDLLYEAGTQKISFAGGEPMLCPFLSKLLSKANGYGMTTMLITNGQLVTNEWLVDNSSNLDWLTISVDSTSEVIEMELGRSIVNHIKHAKELILCARKLGILIKVNTVVTSLNWEEDMTSFIDEIQPLRWKVFQVLPVKGQNDGIDDLLITDHQFQRFIEINESANPVAESNHDMTSSYLMLDPLARFFHNTDRESIGHQYSASILSVGVTHALNQIIYSPEKLIDRGGVYDWTKSVEGDR